VGRSHPALSAPAAWETLRIVRRATAPWTVTSKYSQAASPRARQPVSVAFTSSAPESSAERIDQPITLRQWAGMGVMAFTDSARMHAKPAAHPAALP
jgi:hypothetical protein